LSNNIRNWLLIKSHDEFAVPDWKSRNSLRLSEESNTGINCFHRKHFQKLKSASPAKEEALSLNSRK